MDKKIKEKLNKRINEGISLSLGQAPGMRSEKELFKALEEIESKAWYNRNKMLQDKGKISREQMPSVIKAERALEKKYGFDNLNRDYDDFEWGELMGKLQTIRWVLGCDWGNCST